MNDYNNHRISMENYRSQRKQLLDQLDQDVNGVSVVDNAESAESSFFGKVINLIKAKGVVVK